MMENDYLSITKRRYGWNDFDIVFAGKRQLLRYSRFIFQSSRKAGLLKKQNFESLVLDVFLSKTDRKIFKRDASPEARWDGSPETGK